MPELDETIEIVAPSVQILPVDGGELPFTFQITTHNHLLPLDAFPLRLRPIYERGSTVVSKIETGFGCPLHHKIDLSPTATSFKVLEPTWRTAVTICHKS